MTNGSAARGTDNRSRPTVSPGFAETSVNPTLIERVAVPQLARHSANSMVTRPSGEIWSSSVSKAFLKESQILYPPLRAQDKVRQILEDSNGTLWVATYGGLSAVRDDHVSNLTMADGLPSDLIRCLMEDDVNSF